MDQSQKINRMLQTIERECSYTAGMTGVDHIAPHVLDAMATVQREDFVPREMKPFAYDNNPLPIGFGQTISQPFIVALMTDLLQPNEDQVILEIGAGSGYQAAILATLVKEIYTLEIIPELAGKAEKRLARLGFDNVVVMHGNGYMGYPAKAPYDGIIVTAAATHIPPPLKEQLKPGGRLVIPVGRPHAIQHLLLIEKDEGGNCITQDILSVAFVPLTGGHYD